MAAMGYHLHIERLTLEIDRGLVARNIRLYADADSPTPFLEAETMAVMANPWTWLRRRPVYPILAIENADVVVLGPGSLFTSIIPNLMFSEVSEALKRTAAPKIYITNLMTQPGETDGMSIMDHVRWITRTSGSVPDYVFTNEGEVPSDLLETYLAAGAVPLMVEEEQKRSLSLMGSRVVVSDFLDVSGGSVRHNSQKIAEALIRIAREERDTSRWKS